MQELWANNTFWRIVINLIAVFSIIFGFWLVAKLVKSLFLNNKQKKLMDEKFINIKNLPNIFTNNTQICLVVNYAQNVDLKILDENEISIFDLHNGKVDKGEKIFILNTKELKNGNYHLFVKTDFQNIFRKFKIEN